MAAINHPYAGSPGSGRFGSPVGQINRWLVLAVLVAGLSSLLPVLQNSSVTSRGFALQDIERQKISVLGQIDLVEADVARLTSLQRIERRASAMGLHPADAPLYVTVDEAGPAPAKIPAEYLSGPGVQTGGPVPWWRSLLDWLAPLN